MADNASKTYLGDSVYAEFDGYAVTLTTENGFGPSNTIVLEPEVISALNLFYRRCISGPAPTVEAPPEQAVEQAMCDFCHCAGNDHAKTCWLAE